jgi:hypothetical protein
MYLRVNDNYANCSTLVYKFDKVVYQKLKAKLPLNKKFAWQEKNIFNFFFQQYIAIPPI